MKKIQYLKDKIEKYKKKNGSNEEKSEDSESNYKVLYVIKLSLGVIIKTQLFLNKLNI